MKTQLGVMVVVAVALLARGALGESRTVSSEAVLVGMVRQVVADTAMLDSARRRLEGARNSLEQVLSACGRHPPSIELDQILMDVARDHQERAVSVERRQAALGRDQLKMLAAYWRFLMDGGVPGRRVDGGRLMPWAGQVDPRGVRGI